MSVSAVSNDNIAQPTATAGSAAKELSDRFLKLLVTQLRNQDPMNPMENAELTTQLAQMSTVEGINKLNEGMSTLSGLYRSSQVIQGAALVGRQVLAEGDALPLTAAGAAGGVDLAAAADSVKIKILNGAGAVVRVLDLGGQAAGLVRFVWDGKDALGNAMPQSDGYRFKVEAGTAGASVATTSYALGSVQSVAVNDEGMEAEVAGLGMRDFSQIKQIF
jgi:flagellar basal-body rod modification protein FlgD